MYAIKTPSFDVKQQGCRQTPPAILWFGGSRSSVAVLTTSLINLKKRIFLAKFRD